ncbi:hypothetical protein C1H46_031614 [Malus baccata]|uniref:Uncharacterized protein n=1 Tax=Malus baccata TaxID=106549 RepID=A0A540L8L0_MALBA|nr:hypothetical protein C1H46_031614 [Malus baccata]
MKPQPKGRSSSSTDQSIRQHEVGSCYDFTKVSKALRLAHNSLNNDVVDHCSNSIVMKDESAPRAYDFREMSEALSCEDNDRNSLALHQALIIMLGRLSFLKTRENMIRSEPLKVRKVKLVNVKTAMYNLTSRSLRK